MKVPQHCLHKTGVQWYILQNNLFFSAPTLSAPRNFCNGDSAAEPPGPPIVLWTVFAKGVAAGAENGCHTRRGCRWVVSGPWHTNKNDGRHSSHGTVSDPSRTPLCSPTDGFPGALSVPDCALWWRRSVTISVRASGLPRPKRAFTFVPLHVHSLGG
jgi:hypothetical protein